MNRFNYKTALVIILLLIFAAGIFLLLKTPKTGTPGQVGDKGFLSFFGERKNRTGDETVVPGATTGGISTTAGNAGGTDSGSASGLDTTTGGQNGTGVGQNGGGTGNTSLSLRSIGTNVNTTTGGLTTGGQSGGSGSGSIGTGSSGRGGTATGGGATGVTSGGCPASNPNCNKPIQQIDCTPPQLPYTEGEVAQLKSLVGRFYGIAAGLKTEADVQNEIGTRESYYDLVNQANTYTKQCLAEIAIEKAKPVGSRKALDNNPRWHPYLSANIIKKLPTVVKASAFNDKLIIQYNDYIAKRKIEVAFLNGITRNAHQEAQLTNIKKDIASTEILLKDALATQDAYKKGSQSALRQISGTFFPEERYIISRNNDDFYRRYRIFNGIKDHLFGNATQWDSSNNYPAAINLFFCGSAECAQENPLQWLHDRQPTTSTTPVHQLQALEDALGVW